MKEKRTICVPIKDAIFMPIEDTLALALLAKAPIFNDPEIK